jgi:hypothetical protein
MNKKILPLAALFFLVGQTVFSQTVTLSGFVADSKNQPLEAASVSLLRSADSSLVKMELTDAVGRYEFSNIKPGAYRVAVSMLGFEKTIGVEVAALTPGETYAQPPIQLAESSAALQEVTVAAKKPFVEKRADRLIVNVESSIAAAGSNTLEVLERSPGVVVDQNDNISLRGKSGVLVMIDGKLQVMSGTELGNFLRGLPANSVERIEIITNPSAKYDAQGNAGIIDIRMKKDQRLGLNGTFNSNFGQGRYPKAGAGLSLNFREKKVNLFGNYNYNFRKGFNHLVLYRSFFENGSLTGAYDQDNFMTFPFNTHNARIGADFFPSKKTIIGVVASGVDNRFKPKGDNISQVLNGDSERASYFTTSNRSQDRWNNYALNLNLKQTLDSAGQELTADLDHARYWNETDQKFTTNYFDLSDQLAGDTYIIVGDLNGNLNIYSAKADYVKPLPKHAKIEAGVKSSYVEADNDVQFFSQTGNGPLLPDAGKSNRFIYKENINAAYLNWSQPFGKKFSVQAGLRAEQTNVDGNQVTTNFRFDTSYLRLFPSVFLSQKLNEKNQIDLSVSRRLNRPSYSQLNPFKFFLDPSTFKEGNPYLRPQFTWNYELSYTLNQLYIFTLGYSKTTDNITNVIIPDEQNLQVTIQTDKNLTTFEYYGLNVYAPASPAKWWNFNNNLNVYYGHYTGDLANTPLSNGNAVFSISSNHTFTLGNGFAAELNGMYHSKSVYGYMVARPQGFVTVGVQKNFADKRSTLKFSVSDIFYNQIPAASMEFTDYTETFRAERETRVAMLTFSHRFGKNTVAPSRRRTGGAEEEKGRAGAG